MNAEPEMFLDKLEVAAQKRIDFYNADGHQDAGIKAIIFYELKACIQEARKEVK